MRLIAILISLLCVLIGTAYNYYNVKVLKKRQEYCLDYLEKFNSLCKGVWENKSIDEKLYSELMYEANKIQRELGVSGIVSMYYDPLRGYQINVYALFLNFFGNLREYMINFHLMKEQIYLLINSCKDVLIMHLGSLQEAIDLKKRKMINPIFCFCIGIRCILGMPIKVLEWSGVISSSSSIKIAKSRVSTLISGIVAVVSLIGSIITIIIGWDEVVELVHSIF